MGINDVYVTKEFNGQEFTSKLKCELYNDHFENAKRYNIPHAQLIIADIPYNLGNNAYASNPSWYKDGDNKNGESELAGKTFFKTDENFKINNFFDFCTRYLKKEPKEQLAYFKELYSSFTYHFQNDLITIFSLKHKYDNAPDEYSVFAALKGDYIVEFPPIKDLLKEKLCAPACAIWWYNADGTRADFDKFESNTKGQQHYLTFHSEEEKQQWIDFVKNGNEIINPNRRPFRKRIDFLLAFNGNIDSIRKKGRTL